MDYDEFPAGFLPAIRELCLDLNPSGRLRSREALDVLGIDIIAGPRSTYLPPHPLDPDDHAAVMLSYDRFGWTETRTLKHELFHALVDQTGYGYEVLTAHGGDKRRAQPTLERMAWLAGTFWLVPQTHVDGVLKLWPLDGDTAMLLAQAGNVTPEQAMVRLVFNEPGASVAGFTLSGGLVHAVATCNSVIPCLPYQRMAGGLDGVHISRPARWRVGIVA